jgi:hypothetical protein
MPYPTDWLDDVVCCRCGPLESEFPHPARIDSPVFSAWRFRIHSKIEGCFLVLQREMRPLAFVQVVGVGPVGPRFEYPDLARREWRERFDSSGLRTRRRA